jgi:hypothetical protein
MGQHTRIRLRDRLSGHIRESGRLRNSHFINVSDDETYALLHLPLTRVDTYQ